MAAMLNVDGTYRPADGSQIGMIIGGIWKPISKIPTLSFIDMEVRDEKKDYEIKKIEVLVPNKVVRVTFEKNADYSRRILGLNLPDRCFKEMQQKSICNEKEDEFSLRKGVLVCLAKHLYGDVIMADKIEIMAEQLDWYKVHNKKVTKAIRTYEKEQKALAEKEKREAEEKERLAKKKVKNAEKRRKKKCFNANIDVMELANSMGKMLQDELKRL